MIKYVTMNGRSLAVYKLQELNMKNLRRLDVNLSKGPQRLQWEPVLIQSCAEPSQPENPSTLDPETPPEGSGSVPRKMNPNRSQQPPRTP